jgi:hypothetical protein
VRAAADSAYAAYAAACYARDAAAADAAYYARAAAYYARAAAVAASARAAERAAGAAAGAAAYASAADDDATVCDAIRSAVPWAIVEAAFEKMETT